MGRSLHGALARENPREPARKGAALDLDCANESRGAAARMLGAELRRLRLELGLSQRALTKIIGLSAHSNLGEYERGSRVPPMDIVIACERALATEPGYLQELRRSALRERARDKATTWSAPARDPGRGRISRSNYRADLLAGGRDGPPAVIPPKRAANGDQ